LLRARETAADLGFGTPEPRDELAPGATVAAIRAAVAELGETVIVVGHQPDCSEIAAALSGGPEPKFPPAGFQILEL
jgi:phosphohistidine phosphatase SixA